MEWYFTSNGDDLIVPKDMKPTDRLPSPDSWSEWGISDFPKKNCDEKNLCEELDLSISRHEMECSSNSSIGYGFQSNLQQWGAPTNRQPDCHMNDIYLYTNSLLDEDLATENMYGSSSFSTHPQYSAMSGANISAAGKSELEHTPFHSNGLGGPDYLDDDAFPPTADWNREATNSFPSVKAPVLEDSMSSQHGNVKEYMQEQTSLEESVLQELEMVTAKLNVKTRNCFRDSLYRLAENSRKNTSTLVQSVDKVPVKTSVENVSDDSFSVQETEATESKTNAIDRAIANLMFAKMEFYVEAPRAESLNMKGEADGKQEQFNYSSGEPWGTCFPILIGDAEVPTK